MQIYQLFNPPQAGLPIIVSSPEYAGCSEQIKNNEAVFIHDPGSPDEIADALRSLFNEERRKELGKRGQKLSEKLTWEKTFEDTLSVYHDVIKYKYNC